MARRIYEGAPLEEALVAVDEACHVLEFVLPEAAPKDEKVATRDDTGGVELKPDEPIDRREDAAAVRALSLGAEKLRVDDQSPRRTLADLEIAHVRGGPGGSRRRDERSP